MILSIQKFLHLILQLNFNTFLNNHTLSLTTQNFPSNSHMAFPSAFSPLSNVLSPPPNLSSANVHADIICASIIDELRLGHYLGPFTRVELEQKIGPFHLSPLQVNVKKGALGEPIKYCVCWHLSYKSRAQFSINYKIDLDDFPTCWGKAADVAEIVCFPNSSLSIPYLSMPHIAHSTLSSHMHTMPSLISYYCDLSYCACLSYSFSLLWHSYLTAISTLSPQKQIFSLSLLLRRKLFAEHRPIPASCLKDTFIWSRDPHLFHTISICHILIFWHCKPVVFPWFAHSIFCSIFCRIPKRNHHKICYAEMAFTQHVIVFLRKESGRTF